MKDYLSLKKPLVMVAVQILASLSGITLLFSIQLNNFLLFHYIVETLSILIGLLIFAVTWSGRDIIDNKSIIFLGIAYLFVAILGSFHLISTEGMGILNMTDPNHSIQIWISARYIEATSILLVSIGVKKFYPKLMFIVYLAVTSLILLGIYKWQIFPVCYSTGAGLTDFKIISEYIFIGILFCSLIFFLYHRRNFQKNFILLFSAAIIITIFSEFCFTLYTSVYDFVNGLGHILKIIYFLFIYKAIFVESIHNPQQILFQNISTKQKEISRKLKDSENIYQTLLENLPYYVFILNRDSNYVLCNTSYCQFAQREKSEIIGKNIFDVHPKWIAEKYYQENLELFEKGTPIEYEDKVIIAKKETFIKTKKVPIIDDGKIVGILGIFQDITEQKKFETELEEYRQHLEELVAKKTLHLESANNQLTEEINERKQAEEDLIKTRDKAESANRAKSNFLANMSHDFRTPLNAILGNTQIFLQDTELMLQYGSSINMIHKSSLHILSMINDILELTNIEAGRIESTPVCTNFTNFLTEITNVFKHNAEKKDLTFILENNTDPSMCIKVDEKQLHKVLYYLLSNAVNFTDSGSVFLKISHSKTSSTEPDNKRDMSLLIFEVRDTGIGIEKKKLESIFEPFLQDRRKSFNDEGTGLGLTISKKLIKMMGGDLHVESIPGSGSLFWFELKLETGNKLGLIEQPYRNEHSIQGKINITPLIAPPDEVLLSLLELEKVGDIMGIVKLINKIEQDNNDYVTFVKKVKLLIESYQIEKLVKFVNSFLSNEVQ